MLEQAIERRLEMIVKLGHAAVAGVEDEIVYGYVWPFGSWLGSLVVRRNCRENGEEKSKSQTKAVSPGKRF
jgi:hypothetical protein